MKDYLKKLMNQYKVSTGNNSADLNSESFRSEFMKWVEDSLKIGLHYLDWLKGEGIFDDSSSKIAEIGKGKYDALTLGYNTTLITPYMKDSDNITNSNKIITSGFASINGIPLLTKNGALTTVRDIDTLMMQNPYDLFEFLNWHQFYNYGDLDIIIGGYGNKNDKDRKVKLEILRHVQKRLNEEFSIEQETSNDAYYYALATKRKVKK